MSHSSWVVAKFGGTSVRSKACWQVISDVISHHLGEKKPILVVCSAIAGVSDLLESLIEQALMSQQPDALKAIRELHDQFMEDLGIKHVPNLDKEFMDLERMALGINYTQDASAKVRAAIMAKGELFSTRIGVAFLNQSKNLEVGWLDARDFLVSEGDALAPINQSYLSASCCAEPDDNLQQIFSDKVLQGQRALLTQGFIAANEKGQTVLLGRGGSDTSSAYFAAKLQAAKLQIWTDVPGLFTANPHQIPSARLIKRLEYSEAQEMASSGAKVLHPRSIEPLQKQDIPLEIGWTANPKVKGTVISALAAGRSAGVKSISVRYQTPVITLESFGMWRQVGFLADVFSCFKKHHLSIDLVTTSETNVSVTLDVADSELDPDTKKSLLMNLEAHSRVKYRPRCAIISLVGKNIRSLLHELGPSLSVFEEQNIYLVSQAASDLSLTFVVDEDQAAKISKNLHGLLFNDIDKNNPTFGDSWQRYIETDSKTTNRYQNPWWYQLSEQLLSMTNTPCYVYHLPTIGKNIEVLKEISAVNRVFYSVKANNEINVLRFIGQNGLGFECVSIAEVERIFSIMPELDPEKILFTPNFIGIEEYKKAIGLGVLITIDNPHPLLHHPEVFNNQNILLRIDTGVGRGHHDYVRTSGPNAKFGIWPEQLIDLKPIFSAHNITVVGLHAHSGSGILLPENWSETAFMLHEIAQQFGTVKYLDLGGGLGIPERADQSPLDHKALNEALLTFLRLHDQYELWLEPGRFVVSQAGVLLAKVNQLKTKGERRYIGIEAGMHSFIRPALYSAYHPIVNLSQLHEPVSIVADIVGPICESGDVLGRARHLPETSEGDVFLVANTGAYGRVMSSQYNLRALPNEFIIE